MATIYAKNKITGEFEKVGPAVGSIVDTTLTLSGSPADAKATGDAINAIQVNVDRISDELQSLRPKSTSISLPAANWTGTANPYSQVVNISAVTVNSKVDLQPTAQQIVDLQNQEIQLMVENDAGICTCFAIGGRPTSDMNMSVLITEVVSV